MAASGSEHAWHKVRNKQHIHCTSRPPACVSLGLIKRCPARCLRASIGPSDTLELRLMQPQYQPR